MCPQPAPAAPPRPRDDDVIARLLAEGPITASQAARLRPAHRGRQTAPQTVVRWIRIGLRGVKLEGYHDGSGWVTSRRALARFYAALTAKKAGNAAPLLPEQEEWLRRAREAGERLKARA